MKNLSFVTVVFLFSACNASLFSKEKKDPGEPIGIDPVELCVDSQRGEAACQFDGTQGAKSGLWRFLDDRKDRTWAEMGVGTLDGATALAGQGTAIASCVDNTELSGCLSDTAELLVRLESSGGPSPDAALEYAPTGDGEFEVSGTYRVVSGGGAQVLFYRNSREDMLFAENITSDATSFSFRADLRPGDRVFASVGKAQDNVETTVGLDLRVEVKTTEASRCMLHVDFESPNAEIISEGCEGIDYTAQRAREDDESLYDPLTTPLLISSAVPNLGNAMEFELGDHLEPPAGNLVYEASYTFQFWLSFPGGTFVDPESDSPYPVIFSDFSQFPRRGHIFDIGNDGSIDWFSYVSDSSDSNVGAVLSDFDWHHIRFVRNIEDATVYLCIDGKQVATDVGEPGIIASDYYPYFGLNRNGTTISRFSGALDDIRIIDRALPCAP